MNHKNVVDDGVHFPVFIINVFSDRTATTFQSACYFCLVSVCFNEHVWNGFLLRTSCGLTSAVSQVFEFLLILRLDGPALFDSPAMAVMV